AGGGGQGVRRRHPGRQEKRHLLPGVPKLHCRGAVSHLRLPQAGWLRHLRGGGSPGRGRHRAGQGVQRPVSRAPRRHLSHEPRGAGRPGHQIP
ncbi:HB, partial [Dysosmobacter welbionis]